MIKAFWIFDCPRADDQKYGCVGGCGFGFGSLCGVGGGGGSLLDGKLIKVTSAIVGVAAGGTATVVDADASLPYDDDVVTGLGTLGWKSCSWVKLSKGFWSS